jgi:hypothetical protein
MSPAAPATPRHLRDRMRLAGVFSWSREVSTKLMGV